MRSAEGTDTEVFAGHPREPATNLHYMQARWQNPTTGSFLSVDPLVPDEGDPQAFNGYSYARNNPQRYVDPTGMYGCVGSTGAPIAGCTSLISYSISDSSGNTLGSGLSWSDVNEIVNSGVQEGNQFVYLGASWIGGPSLAAGGPGALSFGGGGPVALPSGSGAPVGPGGLPPNIGPFDPTDPTPE